VTIDTALTFEAAMDSIGSLVSIPDERLEKCLKEFNLEKKFSIYPDRGFEFQFNEQHWDLSWKFNKDSAFMHALKKFRTAQDETSINSNEAIEAFREFDKIIFKVGLSYFLNYYSWDSGINETLFEENLALGSPLATSVWECMYNAVEHGSNYGKNGDVDLHLYGGENGALITVEDHGNFEKIEPVPVEEVERIYSINQGIPFKGLAKTYDDLSRIFRSHGRPPITRGLGLIAFTIKDKPIVGSDRHEDKFRAMVMYLK
jgi:hypothetical protein